MKTAPARRQHAVGGAAAAAHSSGSQNIGLLLDADWHTVESYLQYLLK